MATDPVIIFHCLNTRLRRQLRPPVLRTANTHSRFLTLDAGPCEYVLKSACQRLPIIWRQETTDFRHHVARRKEQTANQVAFSIFLEPNFCPGPNKPLSLVRPARLPTDYGDFLFADTNVLPALCVTVVAFHGPPDQHHIQSEEAKHRPCPHQQKCHTGNKTDRGNAGHQYDEALPG